MTEHEEERALDAAVAALQAYQSQRTTCNGREALRVALRAAFVDYEARAKPRERVAQTNLRRPLLDRARPLIEAVCTDARAQLAVVCSYDRVATGSAAITARGILVGIFTDAGLATREIAEGIGMSASAVAGLKVMRRKRPAWEPKIAAFAPMFR